MDLHLSTTSSGKSYVFDSHNYGGHIEACFDSREAALDYIADKEAKAAEAKAAREAFAAAREAAREDAVAFPAGMAAIVVEEAAAAEGAAL